MATRRARANPGGLTETPAAPTTQPEGGALASFDPWRASVVEAARAANSLRGTPAADKVLRSWHCACQVQELRSFVEAGSGKAVLAAVASCAQGDLAMPDWLASAYLLRFRAVTQQGVATWDEAFGKAWPDSAKRAIWLRRFDQMVEVHLLAMDFVKREPRSPMSDFWDAFGRPGDKAAVKVPADLLGRIVRLGVGRTKAQGLLQRAFEIWPRPSLEDIRRSLLAPPRARKL